MVRVLPGLFPGADAAPAGMAPREIQVESQQAEQRVARRTAGGQGGPAGQGAHRRAVVVRTRPAQDVARAEVGRAAGRAGVYQDVSTPAVAAHIQTKRITQKETTM